MNMRGSWQLQAYDLVAGTQGLTMSRYASPKESHRQFPTLAQTRSEDGSTLKGTVGSPIKPTVSHQALTVVALRDVLCCLPLSVLHSTSYPPCDCFDHDECSCMQVQVDTMCQTIY